MKNIFDTHAHYDDEAFHEDRFELLQSIHEQNVELILTCGCNIPSSVAACELAEKFPFIYFAAGFHPEEEKESTAEDLEKIAELLRHEKCVAVGEIGLDYYWEDCCPRALQKERFCQQIEMAKTFNLPVIVHDREAHGDTLDILRHYQPKGVVHCFSGSVEMAREIVKLGMYIGMGGVATFKNARRAVEVLRDIPADRLLLETDAPYLAPVPLRGKRCDSSMIAYTAAAIADIRGTDAQELIDITNENGKRLFHIR